MGFSDRVKGVLLAFISVIAVSNVYLFSKAALSEVTFAQFGVYWFAFGLLWIVLYGCSQKTYRSVKPFTTKKRGLLLLLGLIEIVSTFYFFKAIHTISNPAITSFLGNISPVFVLVLSFLFLNEHFRNRHLAGMLLALFGAFIISYKGNTTIRDVFIEGSQYVIYSSLLSAISSVIIKKNIKNIHPVILTTNRSLFLLVFSLIALLVTRDTIIISFGALINIFAGSLLGPFLTVIAGYLALQYIPLSLRATINSTKGVFVLLGSYLYFGLFPPLIAVLGGMITIAGLLLLAGSKEKKILPGNQVN